MPLRPFPSRLASQRIGRAVVSILIGALSGPASAVIVNPIDPGLSPTIHAVTICFDDADFSYGNTDSTCSSFQTAEDVGNQLSVLGTSDANADLATGAFRARSTAESVNLSRLETRGSTFAELYDTLTVEGEFTGTIPIQVTLDVDGAMQLPGDGLNSGADSGVTAAIFGFSPDQAVEYGRVGAQISANGSAVVTWRFDRLPVPEGSAAYTSNANASGVFDPDDIRIGVSITFNATPGNRSFNFLARLATNANATPLGFIDPNVGETTVDFVNTGQLSLVTPAGVQVSSASGVFLSAVPEPGAGWLHGTALAALGGRLWLSRKAMA
jgi:hypothetical protein